MLTACNDALIFSAQNNVPNIHTHMDACTHTHSWHAHIQACTKYIMHACTPTCMHATTHTQRLIAKEQLSVRTMANCSSAGEGGGGKICIIDQIHWITVQKLFLLLQAPTATAPVRDGSIKSLSSSGQKWVCLKFITSQVLDPGQVHSIIALLLGYWILDVSTPL